MNIRVFDKYKLSIMLIGVIVFLTSIGLALGVQALTKSVDYNEAYENKQLKSVVVLEENTGNEGTKISCSYKESMDLIYLQCNQPNVNTVNVEFYKNEINEENLITSSEFMIGEQEKYFEIPENSYENFVISIESTSENIMINEIQVGDITEWDLERTRISLRMTAILMGMFLFIFILLYVGREHVLRWGNIISIKIEELNWRIQNKYVIFIIVVIFLFMVLAGFNVSHMEQYNSVVANNMAELGDLTLGNSHPIRSDEWLGINTIFHDMKMENMGLNTMAEKVAFYVQPHNWGFAFLPDANAFAFYTLMPYLISSIAIYLFLDILLPNKKCISLIGMYILCFAPESIWWWGPDAVGNAIALVVAFYYFFIKKEVKYKIVCSLVLAFILPYYIITVYPAWDIPMVYLSVAVVIALFIKNKEATLKKKDWLYIVTVVIWVVVAYGCYYISEKETLEAIMNTVYPGKRENSGGELSFEYLIHYLMMPITRIQDVELHNNSENSAYLALYPLPLLLFLIDFKNMLKNKYIVALQIVACVLYIYMYVGMPLWLTKITGFSFSIEARAFTIFGATCVFLLILETMWLTKLNSSRYLSIRGKRVVFNLGTAFFILFGYAQSKYVIAELGMILAVIMLVAILILGNLIIFGYKKSFFVLWGMFTTICAWMIIPINAGIGIMDNTPFAEVIREIEEEESGRWITVDDIVLAKYVNAQGVECLNVLSYPPRFDLFYPLDIKKKQEDIYNRYAHVNINITENAQSSFDLMQQDYIRVNLSESDIDLWNIKYIVTRRDVEIDTEELYTELAYVDALDGYNIYKVNYK